MGAQVKLDKDAPSEVCYAHERGRTPSSAGMRAHQPNCSRKRTSFSYMSLKSGIP
jgi:hypothetical protein